MPTLLNLAGDEDFYLGEPRRSNKVDAGIFLSLAPCMEMLCSPRKKPRCNSTLSLGEAKLQRDAKDLINMLPDECLYEIFRCLPRAQDRSACAGVSKRWLMLQSSMRRSDFKHRSKPSSKTSGERPCGGRSVNTAQSAGATFLEQETYESSSEAAGEGTDIDVGGKRSFEEGKSEKQQPRWTIGYLSRCLEGKKATDVKLAAIAVGTGGCGGLGKLLIRGSASSRGVSDMGLSTIGLGCPALRVLSLWDCPLVSDKGLAAIAKGCRLLEKLDLCSRCPGIGDEGLEAIAQNCPNLLTLNIESCPRVGNNSLKAIGRYCPKLESLSVNDCAHVSDEGIITVVSNLTKLMKLKLQAVKVTDMTLVAIGHYGNSLTDLSLESLHRVTEKGFWSMGRALGLQKLKVLVVTFCPGFTDLGFEAVGQGCLSLKRVSIRKCESLTDNGLKAFTQVTTSFENLRIEECHSISSIGLREMLANCSGRLKVLSLIKCEGIRESALTTMPLPVCESLKTLNIRHCSGVGNGCLALLGRACPQLQYLDLSGLTGIGDSGLLALLESNKTSMMKVSLSGCVQVTDWAVFAIANLCGKNLQTLSLDGCRKVTDPKSDHNGYRSTEGLRSNGLDSPAAIGRVGIDRQVEINVTPTAITRATTDDSPSLSSMSTSGRRSIAAVRAASLRASGLRVSQRLATANEGTQGRASQNLLFSKSEVTEKHNLGALLIPSMSMTIQGGSRTPTVAVSTQTEVASDKMGAISVADKSLLKHMTVEVMAQNQGDDRKEIVNVCGEVPLDSRQFTQFRGENLRARKLFSDATVMEDDKPTARDGNEGSDEPKLKDGKEGDYERRTVDFSERDNEPRIRVDNEEYNKSRLNGEEDDIVKEEVFNMGSSMEFKPERLREIRFGEKLQCPPVSTALSYLNSQEPGEESQAAALNMVDKLLWLNTTGLSQDPQPAKLPEVISTEPSSARGPQNLAQMVESRSPKENIGVFDWVDSQHDEGGGQFSRKNGRGVLASRRGGDKFTPESKKIDCTSYRRKKGSSLHKNKDDKVGEDKSKIFQRSLQNLSSMDASGSKLPLASDLLPGTGNKVETNVQRAKDALTKVAIQAKSADTLRYSKRLQFGKEKNLDKKDNSLADKQNARDAELPLNSGKLSDQQLERSPSCGDSLGMSDIGSDTQLAAEAMQIMVCGAFPDQITKEDTHKAEKRECANLRKARRRNGNFSGPVTSKESEAYALRKRTLSTSDSENGRHCAKRKNTVTSSVAADCEAWGKDKRVHWAEDKKKSQRKGEGRKPGKVGYSNQVGKQMLESQTNSRSSEAKEEKWDILKDTVKVGRRKRKRAIAEDTLSNLSNSEGIDPSSKLAGFQSTGAAVEGALSKAGSALVHLTRRAKTLNQVEKLIDSRSSQANEEKHNLLKDSAKVGRRAKKGANVEDTSGKLSNSKATDPSSKSAGELQSIAAAVEGMCLKAGTGVLCSVRKALNLEEEDKKKLDMQISLKSSEATGNEQDVSKDTVKIVRRPRRQGKMEDALCKMNTDHSSKLVGEVQPTGEAVEGTFLKRRKAAVFSTRQAKNLRQDENLKFETQAGFKSSETKDEKAGMPKGSVKTGRRKGKQANAKDNFCKQSNSEHIEHVLKQVGDVSSTGAAEEGTCLEVGETAVCLTRQATHNAGPAVGSAACAFTGIDGDKFDSNEIVTEPGIQRRKSRRRSTTAATPNWKALPNAASLRNPAEGKVQFNNTSVDAKSPQTPMNDISIKSPASGRDGLGLIDSSKKALTNLGTKVKLEGDIQQVQARKQRMISGALTDQEVHTARIEELKMLFR